MDKNTADISERPKSVFSQCSMRRPTLVGPGMAGRPATLMDTSPVPHGQVLRVVVNRDEKGYGMKVSGDKPVYVQSVKEGGAAEKAGLHADDKIIQVNGIDVMESTHTEVVALIRSAIQVVLTVQQKPRAMGSPSLHARALPMPSSTRITGPKPADNEKLRQFQKERVQTFRLMLEEEQRYVDSLRSELARCPGDEKKLAELTNAERNVATVQNQLQAIVSGQNERHLVGLQLAKPSLSLNYPAHTSIPDLISTRMSPSRNATLPADSGRNSTGTSAMTLPSKSKARAAHTHSRLPHSHSTNFSLPSPDSADVPPPLPKRNKLQAQATPYDLNTTVTSTAQCLNDSLDSDHQYKNTRLSTKDLNAMFLDNEINSNVRERKPNFNQNHLPDASNPFAAQHLFGSKVNVPELQNIVDSNLKANRIINNATSRPMKGSTQLRKSNSNPTAGRREVMVENCLYNADPDNTVPPPLPPRVPIPPAGSSDPDAVNSINKQMSYPLVATCATLVNNYPAHISNHTHHRTKSSPDPISIVSPGDSSRRLVASESLNDLSRSTEGWDLIATPPGTPPPPYPSPLANKRHPSSNRNSANTEDGDSITEVGVIELSPEISPLRSGGSASVLATSSPIVAATTNTTQQPIISMEDDEISDQEVGQLEDHGPFKSLSRLWEHTPHLAVFMNYVLSNSDPSSLLFYLLTDLYKEGNAKDMRKWAYEIHSSFLVPGAPLRLSNVDENIAREIDEVLLKEWDKEEILRKIFWKTRNRAKEELNEQLADFQQKRTAGLGTIFGPPDAKLDEISHDKAKEMKLYESLLLNKLDPFLEELEKESADPRKYITAAALATVITKVFGVRGTHTTHNALDRCPTFISKDKSFRTKLIGRYSRKLNVSGHHYVAQHYFTVISCNNCHQIIYGIGPQGYQCSVCLINLHRQCVKQYDDSCPGPITKKDRGIGKFMERIRPESKDSRRKPSAYFISMEREKRLTEEKDNVPEAEQFPCDRQPGQPVSRSSSDKRPDAVTEEVSRAPDGHDAETDADVSHDNVHNVQRAKSSQPAINRSESYKEHSQKRRQNRERRKISDPNLSKSTFYLNILHRPVVNGRGTCKYVRRGHNSDYSASDLSVQGMQVKFSDVDSDHQELSYHSGSSSNSSLSSSRSSDSPQSLDPATHHPHGTTTTTTTNWDNEADIEPDPPDWQSSVSEEILSRLHPEEKKRQEIINELFHTERSHVRNLKVLESLFYRPLLLHPNNILPRDQIDLLFSNLEEMLDIHGDLNAAMTIRRKEEAVIGDIGELLLNMFDGPAGEHFQQAAAKFCARQQLALESLKERRRKDPRLNSFLSDCESDKLCKRLQLKDWLPTGLQRLVKYPLLFESLAKCTERVLDSTMTESLPLSSPASTPSAPQVGPTHTELTRLKRAVERSKEILNFVNQAVKEADDNARLHDMQKRLDKSGFERVDHAIAYEFRNVDLTKHKLIHEGTLQWRLNKQVKLSVHVVLLEEVILLLQKQDEKYILKFYSSVGVIHSPIVKVSTVLVRHNATEKEALYLVNTSQNGAQIYDLCAQSTLECKQWFKHISDAAEAYKSRDGKSRRSEVSTPEPEGVETSTSDLTTNGDGDKTDLMSGGDNASAGDSQSNADTDSNAPSGESSQRNSSVIEDEADKRLSQAEPENASGTDGNGAVGNSKREAQMRLATEDQPLIQPSEVTVNVLPVHTAQPVITPIEQVRRKDEAIRQALAEKEALVAEILHVPPEDYHTIVDMAGDVSGDKEPTELVLAAINKANQLWSMVSDSLNVSDADTVLATSSQTPSCTSSPSKNHLGVLPSIPSHSVQHIAGALNTHLTELLKVVKEREDEKERMRRELQKLREQLHVMHDAQVKSSGMLCSEAAYTDTEIFHSAGDLANIEEDP